MGPGKTASRGPRVRFPLLIFFVVILLEGYIAVLDHTRGAQFPVTYFYILPVMVGGLYLGYLGGIGVSVLSVALFNIVQKGNLHRGYSEADILWLLLLILLGSVTARIQADRHRAREQTHQLEFLN